MTRGAIERNAAARRIEKCMVKGLFRVRLSDGFSAEKWEIRVEEGFQAAAIEYEMDNKVNAVL